MKLKDIQGLKNVFSLYLRYSEEVLNLLVRKQIEQDILSFGPPRWDQMLENLHLSEEDRKCIYVSVINRLMQREEGVPPFRGFPYRGVVFSDKTLIKEMRNKHSVEMIDACSWDYMMKITIAKNPLTYGVWEGVLLGGIVGGFLFSVPLLTIGSSALLGIQLGRYIRKIVRINRKPKGFQSVNAEKLFLVVLMLLDCIDITDLSDILKDIPPKHMKEEVKEWVADKIVERTKLKIEKRQDNLTILLDTAILVQLLKCIPHELLQSKYADVKLLNHSNYRDTIMPILFKGFVEQLVQEVERVGLILCITSEDISFEVKKEKHIQVDLSAQVDKVQTDVCTLGNPLQQTLIMFLTWYRGCSWNTSVQQVGDDLVECLEVVKQLVGVDSRYVTKFQYLTSLLVDLKIYAEGVQGYERCQRVGNLTLPNNVTTGLVETLQTVLQGILEKIDTVELDILQSLKIQETVLKKLSRDVHSVESVS